MRAVLARAWRGLPDEIAAQAERSSLWAPVAFGAGCASYFGLADEVPLGWALGLAASGVAGAATAQVWARSRWVAIAAVLLAFALCGFAAGPIKTRLVGAPIVPAEFGVAQVEGWVVDVASPSADRARLVIAPTRISRLAPADVPRRIRLVVPKEGVFGPGSTIRCTALLDPPPGPPSPGAYDFARDAWFQGLGGVGVALTPPKPITLPPASLGLRIEARLNGLRWSLARRLAADLTSTIGPEAAGLAVTVTTGYEGWLDKSAEDDLRNSGLAHMLAIAGLHTAAVSGFVFFALRLAVAAWPWLALRVPGKKVAAVGALLAVWSYLALSGGHPPARRAAITASVAFIAILCDRRAVSLRALAIAALVILVLQPEAVVQPGFQMSFSATGALVALAEAWPRRTEKAVGLPWPLMALQKAREAVVGLLTVSFVAGMATSPFAIQYFNRVANWGVFANLTADFVATAVMMPALVVALIAEAFGGGWVAQPALAAAGWAVKAILGLAHLFGTAPWASATVSSAPQPALLVSFLGILFACLWRGDLRWLGVAASAAVLVWPRPTPPVAWMASDGNNAAVVQGRTALVLKPALRTFATDSWSKRRGLALPPDPVKARDAVLDCDRRSCAPSSARPYACQPGSAPARPDPSDWTPCAAPARSSWSAGTACCLPPAKAKPSSGRSTSNATEPVNSTARP